MKKDMYGDPIHRLGDSGFGVSVTSGDSGGPMFTVFHDSDDFHQSLFSTFFHHGRPSICNVFEKRFAEVLRGQS